MSGVNNRFVVLCGKVVVDLERVISVVGCTVTFKDGVRVDIGEKPAKELVALLSNREERGKDAEG